MVFQQLLGHFEVHPAHQLSLLLLLALPPQRIPLVHLRWRRRGSRRQERRRPITSLATLRAAMRHSAREASSASPPVSRQWWLPYPTSHPPLPARATSPPLPRTSGLRYSSYWYCLIPAIALFIDRTRPSFSWSCSAGSEAAAACRCRTLASRCRSAGRGRSCQSLRSLFCVNKNCSLHPRSGSPGLPAALTPASTAPPVAAAALGGGLGAAAAALAAPFCTAFDPPPPIRLLLDFLVDTGWWRKQRRTKRVSVGRLVETAWCVAVAQL